MLNISSDPLCPVDSERGPLVDFCGREFYPFDPRPEDIRLNEIAYMLSRTKRFGNDSDLTVAEHCLAVAGLVKSWRYSPPVQLFALLHDAHEAYTGDIRRPFAKRQCFAVHDRFIRLDQLQAKLDLAITESLFPDFCGLNRDQWEALKQADDIALFWEIRDVRLTNLPWAKPNEQQARLIPAKKLTCMNHEALIRQRYLDTYASLHGDNSHV